MELSVEQLQDLKSIELEILRCFIEICEKENLQYFLIGGTALGAVRHKGFIPWDDDIDVALPRKDYERFMSIAKNHLPEYYFLQSIYTEEDYYANFAKIRDSRTTFIEASCRKINVNHGVYIDIFPLDGHCQSKLKNKIFDFKKFMLTTRINQIFIFDSLKKSLKNKAVSFLSKMMCPNYKTALKKRDALYKKYKYEDSEYVANYCGAWGKKEIMLKSCFGKGTVGEFEGLKAMLPEDYDKYLSNVYGDYMTLPPVEKRIGHHHCSAVDFDKPYTEYMKEQY